MRMTHPALPYVAPFAGFLVFLGIRAYTPFGLEWEYPVRFVVVAALLLVFSRKVIKIRPLRPIPSILVGVAVFSVWIAPDLIWNGYRTHWLFQNPLTGAARSSIPEAARANIILLMFRIAGTALLVPIMEELFWRAWLMRYLVEPDFEKVRLGTYTALSFWLTALLFASEHGPYWEVGLAAGILYNWWMLRSRSLADCILAHAVTNALLAAFVLGAGRWEYWL